MLTQTINMWIELENGNIVNTETGMEAGLYDNIDKGGFFIKKPFINQKSGHPENTRITEADFQAMKERLFQSGQLTVNAQLESDHYHLASH